MICISTKKSPVEEPFYTLIVEENNENEIGPDFNMPDKKMTFFSEQYLKNKVFSHLCEERSHWQMHEFY